MGRVYKAVQPAIGARVAIKVLKRECAADPDLVERFFNEARAVNLIRHDNIVDVIDLGRLPDGAPYIVMEFLEGASLAALLKRDEKVPLGTLARLVGELLAALEAAHAKGIVHRDLKPDNVFVSPGGRVTVLDFGIAKLAGIDGGTPTQTGSLLGTPAYMAPEQARAQAVDARADLYATGVILYEGATGSLPFIAASLYDLLDMQVKAAPPAPRTRNAQIPEKLEAVILRALAKDPADRFATAKEMRRALEDSIEGLASAAFEFPSMKGEARSGPPSDPFAATAASTQGSLARGETRPSTPPERAPAPQRSRRTAGVIAALGLAAVAGGGAVLMRDSSSRPAAAPATQEPAADAGRIVIPPRPLVPPEEPGPDDASVAVEPSRDAAVVAVLPPRDARTRVVRVDAAAEVAATPVEPPSLDDGSILIKLANPRSFDPVAYIKTATDLASKATGNAVLTGINFRGFDRRGIIDLTQPHAVAHYILVALDRVAAKNPYCSLSVMFEDGAGTLSIGRVDSGECTGRRVEVRCSLAEVWKRAEARGLPASATTGNANYIRGYWHFSSSQAPDFEDEIRDDCP